MTNEKPTPGPWEVSEECDWSVFKAGTNWLIAETGTLSSEANAHLIAAAPELLDACRLIVQFHNDMFPHGRPLQIDGRSIDHTVLNEAYVQAERAIDKAEGR